MLLTSELFPLFLLLGFHSIDPVPTALKCPAGFCKPCAYNFTSTVFPVPCQSSKWSHYLFFSFKVSLHCYLYKYAGGPSLQKPFKHSDLLVWFQVSEMRVCLLKKHRRCQNLLGFTKQSSNLATVPMSLSSSWPYFFSRIHNILCFGAYECSMASGDSLTTWLKVAPNHCISIAPL